LKSDIAGENVMRNRTQASVKSIPILLHALRAKDQIIAQNPDGGERIVELETERGSPRRKNSDRWRKRHVHRLVEIDTAVGSATIVVQRGDEDGTV
jgi:hypothetical protein